MITNSYVAAAELLNRCGWDVNKALSFFLDSKSKGLIPPNAFSA